MLYRFGYALVNGTIGVYERLDRVWRVKSKHSVCALASYDLDGDGYPELISGWSNGRVGGGGWGQGGSGWGRGQLKPRKARGRVRGEVWGTLWRQARGNWVGKGAAEAREGQGFRGDHGRRADT